MSISIILSVTIVPKLGPTGILSDLLSIIALENSPALGMVMFTGIQSLVNGIDF